MKRQLPDEVGRERPVNGNPIFRRLDWAPVVADERAMGHGQVAAWARRQIMAEEAAPRFLSRA